MDVTYPRHIRKTDEGLRYELGNRADWILMLVFAFFSAGTSILLILDTGFVWIGLMIGITHTFILWTMVPSLGNVLIFTREELLIQRWGKRVGSLRWEEVAMICTGHKTFFMEVAFKNQDDQILGVVREQSGPNASAWHAVAAAFLPDSMVWRSGGSVNRKMPRRVTRKGAILRSGLGFIVGLLMLYWAWPSPELFLGDAGGRQLALALLLGSFVALAYGLLYIFEFMGHKRSVGMGEFVFTKPFEKGSALVDFVRVAVGIVPTVPRVHAYKLRAKSYDLAKDTRTMRLCVGGIAALLLTPLAFIILPAEVPKSGPSYWQMAAVLSLLTVSVLGGLTIFSHRYLRQMADQLVGIEDVIEFSANRMAINGQIVTACTWPKPNAHMGDMRTGLNWTRMRIDLPGGQRWYDLNAMELMGET